ncbi:TPA: phage holin family protein [Streptococcus suis]|nr:phage holin family protein [Streptococcus suis]
MKELVTINKVLFTTIGGLVGSLFGELDGILYALLIFIIIDYMTGLFAAILEKNLSSAVGFRGIFKKVVILFLVALGHLIDTKIIHHGGAVRTMVIFFYLSNEGVSIIENAVRIGLPIPEKLQSILHQIHDKGE